MAYQVFMMPAVDEKPSRNYIPNPTGADNGSVISVQDGLYVTSAGGSGGGITGPGTTKIGDLVLWNNLVGTSVRDAGYFIHTASGTEENNILVANGDGDNPGYISKPLYVLLNTLLPTPGSMLYKNLDGDYVAIPNGDIGWMLTLGDDGQGNPVPQWAPPV